MSRKSAHLILILSISLGTGCGTDGHTGNAAGNDASAQGDSASGERSASTGGASSAGGAPAGGGARTTDASVAESGVGGMDGEPDAQTVAADAAVTQRVRPCSNLPKAGKWENITPPGALAPYEKPTGPSTAGVTSIRPHPRDSGTIFLGTYNRGLWKSDDCGATFVHLNTGRNGDKIDSGGVGLVIDPSHPDVLSAPTVWTDTPVPEDLVPAGRPSFNSLSYDSGHQLLFGTTIDNGSTPFQGGAFRLVIP